MTFVVKNIIRVCNRCEVFQFIEQRQVQKLAYQYL